MSQAADLAAAYERAHDLVDPARIADDFHRLFYDTERYASATWGGHECWKYPTDLVVYAEIIARLRPSTIIECGTFLGGSALFFANLLDLNGEGRVVTVDVKRWGPVPAHPRIDYLLGPSSTARWVVDEVTARVDASGGPVLVVLDSDHTAPHVLAEMEAYAPLVTSGSYLVVEDTNLNGHPVLPGWGPGPWEAAAQFRAEHPLGAEFTPDPRCERFLLTANPDGWLLRS